MNDWQWQYNVGWRVGGEMSDNRVVCPWCEGECMVEPGGPQPTAKTPLTEAAPALYEALELTLDCLSRNQNLIADVEFAKHKAKSALSQANPHPTTGEGK